jgi:hypothetical protein
MERWIADQRKYLERQRVRVDAERKIENELAADLLWVQMRQAIMPADEVVAIAVHFEYQSDHGSYFETVSLVAEAAAGDEGWPRPTDDVAGEAYDTISDLSVWSPEVARLVFELDDSQDKGALTREQLLAKPMWSWSPVTEVSG